jgi:predicted transcriptional regulator
MTSIAHPRSANRATLRRVTPAPKPLSLRLGHSGTAALEELARLRGVSRAEAARQAIEEAAERERKRTGLAAEARRLAADPEYVAEAREMVEWMDELNDDSW